MVVAVVIEVVVVVVAGVVVAVIAVGVVVWISSGSRSSSSSQNRFLVWEHPSSESEHLPYHYCIVLHHDVDALML